MNYLCTLACNGYSKELTDLTFPFFQQYADKCGLQFKILTERKFPELPASAEKFQIHALDYDKLLFIDADALIFPWCPDLFAVAADNQVILWHTDYSLERFRCDRLMLRDNRFVGVGSWFVGSTKLTKEVWEPPVDANYCYSQITKKNYEKFPKEHLIDDYQLTINIARYGLHVFRVSDLLAKLQLKQNWIWHNYLLPLEGKIEQIKKELNTRDMPNG